MHRLGVNKVLIEKVPSRFLRVWAKRVALPQTYANGWIVGLLKQTE